MAWSRPQSCASRAIERFARLRSEAAGLAGLPADPSSPPPGWCVSTVARLERNDARDVVDAVFEVQRKVAEVAQVELYPAAALHLSLLGCTQREAAPPAAADTRPRQIAAAARRHIRSRPPATFRLAGVDLTGRQLFVEVIPASNTWSGLRTELASTMRALGEDPITYTDTEPVHLNIARLTGAMDEGRIACALELTIGLDLTVLTVETVITDFAVSPESLRVVDVVQLSGQRLD